MRLVGLLVGLVALLVLAEPAFAHHKPGHRGDPPHGEGRDKPARSEASGPESGPGNSGAAHWCKDHFADAGRGEPFPFKNRGQCVSYFARGGDVDDDDDSDGESRHRNFVITAVYIHDNGTFYIQGAGAEDRVHASIGGLSGEVAGYGEGWPEADGAWEIQGRWLCQDDDEAHEARVVVRDSDESHRLRASFPCDRLDD